MSHTTSKQVELKPHVLASAVARMKTPDVKKFFQALERLIRMRARKNGGTSLGVALHITAYSCHSASHALTHSGPVARRKEK